jgi:hypothetical protein
VWIKQRELKELSIRNINSYKLLKINFMYKNENKVSNIEQKQVYFLGRGTDKMVMEMIFIVMAEDAGYKHLGNMVVNYPRPFKIELEFYYKGEWIATIHKAGNILPDAKLNLAWMEWNNRCYLGTIRDAYIKKNSLPEEIKYLRGKRYETAVDKFFRANTEPQTPDFTQQVITNYLKMI